MLSSASIFCGNLQGVTERAAAPFPLPLPHRRRLHQHRPDVLLKERELVRWNARVRVSFCRASRELGQR